MKIPLYQIDAFTSEVFKGNPAAVCPLLDWPDDEILQNIAAENNLSETAFFVDKGDHFDLRWFTPTMEIDLCGHATLASAYVIFKYLDFDWDKIRFQTISGELIMTRDNNLISMDFPAWKPEPAEIPDILVTALGIRPEKTYKSRDLIALLPSEEDILNLKPDFCELEKLETLCTIVTAPGNQVDFVSRVFVPKAGIPEDPVTGSAHSSLIPFWAEKLGKSKMKARQLSKRTGTIFCELMGDRVKISGKCAPYLIGEIEL